MSELTNFEVCADCIAGGNGWANASAYCASKFGLTGLTQALAAEGKPHGIRVCIVYPGGMATQWGVWSAAERHSQTVRAEPDGSSALPRIALSRRGRAPTG